MTWFSLPITQADSKAAFDDSVSAADWLALQPQANASVMLGELLKQIHAFNAAQMPPHERFRTIEALRQAFFSVSTECQRRFEKKPLPLLRSEQFVLDTVRQLWSACTIAYLHCLRACLERDPTILRHGARVAHRALACLRMEQTNCYLGGAALSAAFWPDVHAVLASAEQLGVAREPVSDKLLGGPEESTISGQYAMALLLHLAQPFRLSRAQFAAVSRWFSRWRELTAVEKPANADPKSCCLRLDLAGAGPMHDSAGVPGLERWLVLTDILEKMRQRLGLLAAGQAPESLKLGSGLSANACATLLGELGDRLRSPPPAPPTVFGEVMLTLVAAGPENIHPLLGGEGLKDPVEPTSALSADQIAIFGHVLRAGADEIVHPERQAETWQLLGRSAGELMLLRPPGCGEARLNLQGLLAIRQPQRAGEPARFVLAAISSLYSRDDLSLCITATLFAGKPVPFVAEIKDKGDGKISRHPAFVLAGKNSTVSHSIVLPAALPARAASLRLYRDRSSPRLNLRLAELIERGGDHEHWTLANV